MTENLLDDIESVIDNFSLDKKEESDLYDEQIEENKFDRFKFEQEMLGRRLQAFEEQDLKRRHEEKYKYYDITKILCHRCKSHIEIGFKQQFIDITLGGFDYSKQTIDIERDRFYCPCCSERYEFNGTIISVKYLKKE